MTKGRPGDPHWIFEQSVAVEVPPDRVAELARITAGPDGRAPFARALVPMVAGLHRAMTAGPAGGDLGDLRHVQARIELLSARPWRGRDPAVDDTGGPVRWAHAVRTTVRVTAPMAVGEGVGAWVAVDCADPDGPVLRSLHLVKVRAAGAGTLARARLDGPTVRAGEGTTTRRQRIVSRVDVADYVAATDDASPVHREGRPRVASTSSPALDAAAARSGGVRTGGLAPVVPGLLTLALAAHEACPPDGPLILGARFTRPVPAGDAVELTVTPAVDVETADPRPAWALGATIDGRAVLRHAFLLAGAGP